MTEEFIVNYTRKQVLRDMLKPIFGKAQELEEDASTLIFHYDDVYMNLSWEVKNNTEIHYSLMGSWFPTEQSEVKGYLAIATEYIKKVSGIGKSKLIDYTKNNVDDGVHVSTTFMLDPYAKIGKYKDFLDL